MQKEFMNYDEQLDLLVKKGIYIHNNEYAKDVLKRISYFAIINGYKEIFKQNNCYTENIDFRDIEALYKFDENLRIVMLKYILVVERKLKSILSYSFCETYGEQQEEYLYKQNYDWIIKNYEKINTLVDLLSKKTKNNNYKYIKHYNQKHQNIPLWVLINTLTLGNISNIYNLSKQSMRQKISGEYNLRSSSELTNMLKILTKFRNVCAHNERLYNFKTKDALQKMDIHVNLSLVMKKRIRGANDVFAIIICLKKLLSNEEFEKFYLDFLELVNTFRFQTNKISKQVVFSQMGLPNNWKDIRSI